jgi:hypothetical protein
MEIMGLGFPVFRKAFPKQASWHIKRCISGDLLRRLLEGELLVVGLFFLVLLLVFLLLVPIVLG